MKYYEMTKNFVFREFECGLTLEETAKLCFKSVRPLKCITTNWSYQLDNLSPHRKF
ncbi:regulator [Vibrio cholerae]|nr:regulator [Vibrio cholerae]